MNYNQHFTDQYQSVQLVCDCMINSYIVTILVPSVYFTDHYQHQREMQYKCVYTIQNEYIHKCSVRRRNQLPINKNGIEVPFLLITHMYILLQNSTERYHEIIKCLGTDFKLYSYFFFFLSFNTQTFCRRKVNSYLLKFVILPQ